VLAGWRKTTHLALSKLGPPVRCIEVRADLGGDIDPHRLRRGFSGQLLYTLRSTTEGGGCPDPPGLRRQRLIAAAAHYDFVDLEAARDLHPSVLGRIPPDRRVLSWHGPATDLAGLGRKFDAMTATRARLYRMVPHASTVAQALVPLRLLKSIGHDDVVAHAGGPAGTWTRVLAARYGAPVVSGWLEAASGEGGARADGGLLLTRLLADYPLEVLIRAKRVYGIIGTSTAASLSPLVHNTAYRSLGLPALFLPFSVPEFGGSLDALSAGLDELGLPLRGATVVTPYKEAAFAHAATVTPAAARIGAACLLLRTRSGWFADAEDGVVAALAARRVVPGGQQIAVVGCGGAGRAAAAGLSRADAKVTLVNRTLSRGLRAAERLDLPFVALRDFDPRPFSILINATPVTDALLFPVDGLDPAAVVFDLNYGAAEPRLVATARAGGHTAIDGRQMLLAEASRQFRLMTGHPMPVAETADILGIPPPRPRMGR
jgi:3-dehydroquinate dehydratase/shikimate dehydrogenase